MPPGFFKQTTQLAIKNPKLASLLTLGMHCVNADAHTSHSEELGMGLDSVLTFSAVILVCLVLGCTYNCFIRAHEDMEIGNQYP